MATPIQKAIQAAGGQRTLAHALHVSPGLISQWATGRRPVAAKHVLAIEAVTGVSRHELSPDVFGDMPNSIASPSFGGSYVAP